MFMTLDSGRAINHVKEAIFAEDTGARRGIPKVLVVLTDGRSQDDVNKISKEMQTEGEWAEWSNCIFTLYDSKNERNKQQL